MDSAVFIFDSNDEVSSLEYWVVLLVVRCCCGEGLLMLLSIEIVLLLSSCDDVERESWDSEDVWESNFDSVTLSFLLLIGTVSNF